MTDSSHNGSGLVARVQRAWGPGPLQSAKMKGPAPDRLLVRPVYPRTADAGLAAMLLGQSATIGDEKFDLSGGTGTLWARLSESNAHADQLQHFEWLPALVVAHKEETASRKNIASDGDKTRAQSAALSLTKGWLDHYERWSPDAWSPTRLANRLMYLCCHADFLMALGDSLWRSRLLNCMARQTRHLAQIAHKAMPGHDMLLSALGLNLAGLCLPACAVAVERGEELTRRELRLQVRNDGGYISRNPSEQLEFTIRLQMVALAYRTRKLTMPGHIRLTLTRMAAMCEFFRCGDGKLAVFNGAHEDDAVAIIAAGQAIDAETAPVGFARYTKFQRLGMARALIIADVGDSAFENSPLGNRRGSTYDSAGSFQFSSGRSRIIVNCGSGDHLGGDWSRALRQASAHSSFSLDGDPGFRDGLYAGGTRFQRAEEVSGLLLEIVRPFSPRAAMGQVENRPVDPEQLPGHTRRLYLAAGGDDLRGEDRMIGLSRQFAPHWRLRFHLHPSVKASLARDGQSVILVLPTQEGWRFRTSHMDVRLEKSVYFGGDGRMAHTEQIVLAPPQKTAIGEQANVMSGLDSADSHDIIIKWALRRLDGV